MSSGPLNTRPGQQSHFVELTPKGPETVRRWATGITLGSFLFGFDAGGISGACCSSRRTSSSRPSNRVR